MDLKRYGFGARCEVSGFKAGDVTPELRTPNALIGDGLRARFPQRAPNALMDGFDD
jgi:hypothetical protein